VGQDRYREGFDGGDLSKRAQLEDTRIFSEYNIKMDLREVGCGGMDWIELAQDTER
jgi:hypothetical protein